GRIGTDSAAIQFAGPLARDLLLAPRLQPDRAQTALDTGEPRTQAYAARVHPDFIAGDANRDRLRRNLLRRILAGGLPDVPCEIVVGHPAARHREIEDSSGKLMRREREIAGVARQQAALPMRHALSGRNFV